MMRQALCGLFAACAAAVSGSARASADLEIHAQVDPPGALTVNTEAIITLTIHNHGPEDATFVSGVSSGYPFLIGQLFELYPAGPLACDMAYDDFAGGLGEPWILVAGTHFDSVPAGTSQQCTIGLFVFPTAEGSFNITFRASAFQADDNPSNDSVVLGLTFQAPAPLTIPAAGTWALLTLAGALVFGGLIRRAN